MLRLVLAFILIVFAGAAFSQQPSKEGTPTLASVNDRVLSLYLDHVIKVRGIINSYSGTKQRYRFSMDDGSAILVKGDFPDMGGVTYWLTARVAKDGNTYELQEISRTAANETSGSSSSGSSSDSKDEGNKKSKVDPFLIAGVALFVFAAVLIVIIARRNSSTQNKDDDDDVPSYAPVRSGGFVQTIADEPSSASVAKNRPRTEMMIGAVLKVTEGPHVGLSLPLHAGENTIGRDSGELKLPDDVGVSGTHALIHATATGVIRFEDKSRHGSIVDGKQLLNGDKADLKDNSVIKIGGTTLQLSVPAGTAKAASEPAIIAPDPGSSSRRAPTLVEAPKSSAPATQANFGAGFEVIKGPRSGESFTVSKVTTTIGREDRDIVIDEPTVSRKHATVTFSDGSFKLVDDGSTHGTKVNGNKIGPTGQILADGDEIVLGDDGSTLKFLQIKR